MFDDLIQALILQELKKHPEGMTTKQIHKAVKKKMKKIIKLKKLWEEITK